jgi:hypothetical protein
MCDGLSCTEVFLCISSKFSTLFKCLGWWSVEKCRSDKGNSAVATTVLEAEAFGIVHHHPGTTDHGDGGAAWKAGFAWGDTRHTDPYQGVESRMQEVRPIFRLNTPGERKSSDVDCSRITGNQCRVSTGLCPGGCQEWSP